jgi:Tol biopolymer transport system component
MIVCSLALLVGIAFLLSTLSKPEPCLGEIAFVSDRSGKNEIYLMNAGCSEESRLIKSVCNNDDAVQPNWSLDGKKVVYACIRRGIMPSVSGIHMLDLETNRDTTICSEPHCAGSRGIASDFEWTHNGACLAWLTADSTMYHRVEMGWSEDGKQPDPICGGWGTGTNPPGDYTFVHYYNEPCSPNSQYCLYADWSPDRGYKTYLFSMSGISSALTADIFHRGMSRLFSSASEIVADTFHRAAWSPNSEYVALTLFDGKAFTSSLYLVEARHPQMVQMAIGMNISEGRLSWSPDSRWVAFVDNNDIYALDIQTGKVRRITTNAGNNSSPVWRPLQNSD